MRLVADTNIIVSGLLWAGVPGRLMDAAQDSKVDLISSPALLTELWTVVSRRKFASQLSARGLTARQLYDGYARLVILVHPAEIVPVIARDPADDEVLAAALAGQADMIVSGDEHLLDLGGYRGIAIVRAGEAMARLNAGSAAPQTS
ncbi:hypothetical protein IP88_06550 [alpha proteobacterium AAP81b]|nr:hypothetical protein IP88_06550 [alpha proteobacterium AAP81b]